MRKFKSSKNNTCVRKSKNSKIPKTKKQESGKQHLDLKKKKTVENKKKRHLRFSLFFFFKNNREFQEFENPKIQNNACILWISESINQ